MKQTTKVLFASTTLGGTTPIASEAIPLDQIWGYCVQATVAGSVFLGAYQIQGSCQPKDTPPTLGTQWFSVGSPITISAAGSVGTNVPDVCYQWVRVLFTPASGTGTLSVIISSKGA